MGKILDFPRPEDGEWADLVGTDAEALDAAAARALRERARACYDALVAVEPGDEESEEYEAWLERLEALDDLLDDIADRLERLDGE